MKNLLLTAITVFAITASAQNKFTGTLKKYCTTLPNEFSQISEDRKSTLKEIGNYVLETRKNNKIAKLTIICTHNSRRSQMGQIWGQIAGFYYGVDSIIFFSGGTEATAFNERAINALKKTGIQIQKTTEGDKNPKYTVTAGNNYSPILMYSKKYSDRQNPQSDFGAIMVCSEADKSCPVVQGAESRFSLPYDDPKYYDGTPSETSKYDERCRQIARETFFMMDYVKGKLILIKESTKK